MKNPVYILILMASVLLVTSCSIHRDPEKVAEKFLKAFNDRNFDEARKYATPETGKLIDLMENLTKMAQTEEKPPVTNIEIISHTAEGEYATVIFRENETGEEQELKMKLVEGKWYVHITKEDIAAKDSHLGDHSEEEGFFLDDADTSSVPVDSLAAETPVE